MRLNKNIAVFAVLLLIIVPVVTVIGTSDNKPITVSVNNYGDDVGVVAGMTIKYNIEELTLPDMDNVTISNLAGNQLYIKIMLVESTLIDEVLDVNGIVIKYGIGLIFNTDETITIGEGFTAIDLVVPAGSATPPIPMIGVPHFNTTIFTPAPTFFFLDNGWANHYDFLNSFMPTFVTNGATDLTVDFSNSTSELYANWRKSDGILTSVRVQNMDIFGLPFGENTIELSLSTVETIGLAISSGDTIELKADIASLDISGTGDLYDMYFANDTYISEIENSFNTIQDSTFMKVVVNEIHGLYYTADLYLYDMETQSLVKQPDEVTFCGFFGNMEALIYALDPSGILLSLTAPAVTPDFDIYTGYMVLADTIVDVYIENFLSFLTDVDMEGLDINAIAGTFDILEKKDYFYLKESIDVDANLEISETIASPIETNFDLHGILHEEGWIAYTETGILAGLHVIASLNVEILSSISTYSAAAAGTMSFNIDFKLRNPNYNPYDPIEGGILPGYTWLVSIPALVSLVAIGIIRRRK
ncbi:MAG: hypothetical protein FK734_05705 [Asgard group archaeon]|nr:hypothetical protein [Asgard group archaeon]